MKKNFAAEEVVIAITMGIMTLLTAGNVIARKVFQSSFSFVEEITIILFIVSTLLGTAIAAKRNQHMGFSGLTEILGEKGRLLLEVLGELICIAFFILVFWHGVGMVQGEIRSGMTTPALGLPEWIYGLSIPVGALFIIFRYLGRLKSVFIKKGGEE